jgi:hypothetical protein
VLTAMSDMETKKGNPNLQWAPCLPFQALKHISRNYETIKTALNWYLVLGVCLLLRVWDQVMGFIPSMQRYYRTLILILILLYCYMFRSCDHLQAENILLARITQLTPDVISLALHWSVHTHTHTRTHARTHARAHTRTHTHTHTHARAHTHI